MDIRAAVLGLGVFLASSLASAYPVALIHDNRSANAAVIEPNVFGQGYDTYWLFNASPDPDFSDFDTGFGTQGRADQQSTVSTLGFQSNATGFALSNSPENTEYGRSLFSIIFDVTQPTTTWIAGSVSADGGESSFELRRISPASEMLYEESVSGGSFYQPTDTRINELLWEGILQPGQYQVYARAAGIDGGGHHDFQVSFSPEIAPEPSTALLFGLGLGLMARTRRRAR